MKLEDLKSTLASSIARDCGTPPDDGVLENYLERARKEYGRQRPRPELHEFSLGDTDYTVTLPTSNNIVAVAGVYVEDVDAYVLFDDDDRFRMDLPSPLYDGQSRPIPSLEYIEAVYREKFKRELDYLRQGSTLRIVKHRSKSHYRGIVVYHRLVEFEELEDTADELIMKYAQALYLEDRVGRLDGQTRIPTPLGYLEWDAGRNLRELAKALKTEFYDSLSTPTGYITSG